MAQRPARGRRVAPDARRFHAIGPVRVETYTVTFDREGEPERGIVACLTGEGCRTWGNIDDLDTLRELCIHDGIGRSGTLKEGGLVTLD